MSPTKTPLARWLVFLTLCFLAPFRASAGESPWYLEARIGQPRLDGVLDGSFYGLRVGDEVSSTGLEAGYSFNRYFAVQVGYRDLEDAPALPPPCIFCELDERLIVALDAEVSGMSLAAVPQWPVSERFSLYGKVGIFHWDADVEVAFSGNRVASVSDEALLAAVGAHYGWPSGFGVLLEYEVVDDLFDGANLGLRWRF